ncbi:TatD family [Chaetomium tenue]|uniref:TatD family n=1 Tax=Chaetomium tenue TaxID=1854479 RepID=A0ACB7P830_9PEZI|nr:TatD family [Chaetomium globosum]
MCNLNDTQSASALPEQNEGHLDDFPWHIGVCDAHCHPTDTMSSVASVGSMRVRALTIMATRSQDQDLVTTAAAKNPIRDRSVLASPAKQDTPDKIIPAFGWHPWFSYQLYDDTEASTAPSETTDQHKTQHYRSVLSPQPDDAFIASLPNPIPLSTFLADTRQRVLDAGTALVGEVGLDKAFRLPWPWGIKDPAAAAEHTTTTTTATKAEAEAEASAPPRRDETLTPGGREGRMLSPHHVKMAHQIRVLQAQLRLAGELGVAVSIHGVQAHGVLFDALAALWKGHEREVVSRKKQKMVATGAEDFSSSSEDEDGDEGGEWWGEEGGGGGGGGASQPATVKEKRKKDYKPKPFPPRVCLHSYSGSPQMMQQYLHPAIPVRTFFSLSTVINLSTAGGENKFADVVRACPDDRLLVESDLHCAGEEMDRVLENISRRICAVKGWTLEEGLTRMRKNYEEFIFG